LGHFEENDAAQIINSRNAMQFGVDIRVSAGMMGSARP
jgi:hypothetical protein